MKTSIFAAAATLFFAAFVAATPAPIQDLDNAPVTLEPRCASCESACPNSYFFYGPKKCCLQNGGPKNPPSPPKDRGCPNNWYWNGDKNCCTPRFPRPQNPPKPSCGTSTFPDWDDNEHCCKKHHNPPSPQPSRRAVPEAHQPKSKYTARKAELKNRQPAACPAGTIVCPLKDGLECLESAWELRACGGCPTFGIGQDCTAIKNGLNVGCEAVNGVPSCVVHSCDDGFKPSANGKSCVAA